MRRTRSLLVMIAGIFLSTQLLCADITKAIVDVTFHTGWSPCQRRSKDIVVKDSVEITVLRTYEISGEEYMDIKTLEPRFFWYGSGPTVHQKFFRLNPNKTLGIYFLDNFQCDKNQYNKKCEDLENKILSGKAQVMDSDYTLGRYPTWDRFRRISTD